MPRVYHSKKTFGEIPNKNLIENLKKSVNNSKEFLKTSKTR